MSAVPLAAQQSPGQIARASGSNFLISFLFLSPGRRRALCAVYAFCRVVDDAVDLAAVDDGLSKAEAQLAFWEEELEAAFEGRPTTALGFALHRAAETFALDAEPLRELLRGVHMDLEPPQYESFAELQVYMSRVASAVGIACLPIFGADTELSQPYAEALGKALQYTNILRDLAEDAERGRCYLPRDALQKHGLSPDAISANTSRDGLASDGPLAALLSEENARAQGLFEQARALLPAKDRRALKPARIMGSIYQDLLHRVNKLGPLVLTMPRVRCPLYRKVYLALFGI